MAVAGRELAVGETAIDISDLNQPIALERQFSRYLTEFLRRPTDFSPADQSFGSMIANPMLFMGPGGQAPDPRQAQAAGGTAYLGNRAGLAQSNLMQRNSFADLLLNAGKNIGQFSNDITNLEASQLQGGAGGLGMLGI